MKSDEEDFANKFDMDLYALIHKAESRDDEHWTTIAMILQSLRPKVRRRMNEADLKGTEG